MTPFLEAVQNEVAEGRVKVIPHHFLPLTMYSYTEETVYGKLWNDTNRRCRGLVLDAEGNILNHPFPKFFNYEELSAKDKKQFSSSQVESVCTKEDGSLIIVFYYLQGWIVTTRGAWDSEQAISAAKILIRDHASFITDADKTKTYLFELIGPNNFHVIRSYVVDELVLLGIRDEKTDEPLYALQEFAKKYQFSSPKEFSAWSPELYAEISECKSPHVEGVVLKNRNGDRCKVKSKFYCRLHRLVTELTDNTVFEMWRDKSFEQLEGIPDEFYEEIRQKIDQVEQSWQTYLQQVFIDWNQAKQLFSEGRSRKSIAQEFEALKYVLTVASSDTDPTDTAFKLFCKRKK